MKITNWSPVSELKQQRTGQACGKQGKSDHNVRITGRAEGQVDLAKLG